MKTCKKKQQDIRKLRKDVRQLIAEIARVNPKEVKENAKIRDDLGVDSLAAVEILAVIEKRLGIDIDEAEAFDVVTVNDLLELVVSGLKKKEK